jgi:hypothetical protein
VGVAKEREAKSLEGYKLRGQEKNSNQPSSPDRWRFPLAVFLRWVFLEGMEFEGFLDLEE